MSRYVRKSMLIILILIITVNLSACYAHKKQEYYSNTDNYVTVTGTLSYISYDEDEPGIYLSFTELSPEFSDNCFKIVGDNLLIAQENGLDEKLEIGKSIEFVSAPRYFGDGYIMPIVSISIDGETLLEFEDGYENWLGWID